MTTTENIAALERAAIRWNADDVDGYLKLYRDDAVLHGYAGVEPGIESIRSFYRAFFDAFPASKLELQDVLAADDRIACRFVVSGVHRGPFQGVPATHKPFSLPGITILRFADGRCVERWSQADFLSLLQQLGVMPV
jgi:steroid delta-isomerase-like uncharacterized protein